MADLVEATRWEDGIYQFETSDPVMGGPDGVDNRQAKQLANRTRYLKAQQEAHVAAADAHPQYQTQDQVHTLITAAINALISAAPGSLDTLKELADALGDDPNFATTMTNALALKAPLASPVFLGTPKVPTQAAGDNTLAAASTAFVQALIAAGIQSGGKISGTNSPNLLLNGSGEFGDAGWQTSLIPAASGLLGAGPFFQNQTAINGLAVQDMSEAIPIAGSVALTYSYEVNTSINGGLSAGRASVYIEAFNSSGTPLGTSGFSTGVTTKIGWTAKTATWTTPVGTTYVVVHKAIDNNPIVAAFGVLFRRIKVEAGNNQSLFSHEASIKALGSLFTAASNNYVKFPNGIIVQWGTAISNGAGIAALTLPLSFPNQMIVGVCNYLLNGAAMGVVASVSSASTKSILYGNVFNSANASAVVNGIAHFITIGF
jgi:hypothetical protein